MRPGVRSQSPEAPRKAALELELHRVVIGCGGVSGDGEIAPEKRGKGGCLDEISAQEATALGAQISGGKSLLRAEGLLEG